MNRRTSHSLKLECPARTLTGADLTIWVVLYRATRGGVRLMRVGDIADRAGVCHRSVLRALPRLEQAGLIRIQRGKQKGTPSTYRALRPKCSWLRAVVGDRRG